MQIGYKDTAFLGHMQVFEKKKIQQKLYIYFSIYTYKASNCQN